MDSYSIEDTKYSYTRAPGEGEQITRVLTTQRITTYEVSKHYITLPEELEELYEKLNELEARIKHLESIILDKNVVQLKEVPIDEACQLVLEYLKKHPGAHTSDIVFALEIDNEIVEQALKKLWEEGKVEPVEEEKIGATLP
jgi:hypothetical protein